MAETALTYESPDPLAQEYWFDRYFAFHERVRNARSWRGSQKEFADAIGVDEACVAAIEAGDVVPDEELIVKIANALGYSPLDFCLSAGVVPAQLRIWMQRYSELACSELTRLQEATSESRERYLAAGDLRKIGE